MNIRHLISLLLFLFFCTLPCSAQEFSRLYLVKNSQKSNLDNFVQMYLREYKYDFTNTDGYVIKPTQNSNTDLSSSVILIKQTGADCYFYYLSNNEDDDLTKILFKRIKVSGLKMKKIKNDELLKVFHQDAMLTKTNTLQREAQKTSSNGKKSNIKYDFSDEAQAQFDSNMSKYQGLKTQGRKTISENKNVRFDVPSEGSQNSGNQTAPSMPAQINIPEIKEIDVFNNTPSALKGRVVLIPKGEQINAVLQSSISSASVSQNDTISATLTNDWIYNGVLLAPAGSILYGTATEAKKAGYAYGNGEIQITFREMMTLDGQRIQLGSNSVKLTSGVSRSVKIASRVIGGAILGVASGALYALISGGDIATGLAVGAGVGGAGGALNAATQKGQEIDIPSGTNFEIKFTDSMNVSPAY